MNIAFLTFEYPHEKVTYAAGIGTSTKILTDALVRQGHHVSVFVYGQQSEELLFENGIKIHLIDNKIYPIFSWYRYRKYLQQYLNKYIVEDQIDIVEAPDWTGITAFMKLKAPLVLRFHGTDAYFCHLENRKQKAKNFFLEKRAMKSANAFIAPTTFAGKTTSQIFGIKNKPIKTIHNGLPLSQFHNPAPTEFTKGMVLYIGTIIRKKGVFELPGIFSKVLADFPEAQLVMIGDDTVDIQTQSDSTWKILQSELNDQLKSRIDYRGKVPYQQVQEYIKKANVCIFPTFAETLGMVTIESMAMQKAVVNSNIGWADELIDDGVNGYLVHPKDHELFAKRIVELLQNPELCQRIGTDARAKIESNFDIEKLAQDNAAYYSQIINTPN